jgi:large subunit ribosomal protein L28
LYQLSVATSISPKGPQVGHKVSHSAEPVTCISDALGCNVRLRVSTNAIKSVDHRGGLDAFLLKAKATELSPPEK